MDNALVLLNFIQIILMLFFAIIIFLGTVLVQRRYLHRVGLKTDERIANRNAWILFPKQYNFNERALMVSNYISSFFLLVLMVNIGN